MFDTVDYKLLREASPTDKKGKLKKGEKEKLNKQAEKLKELYQMDYQELVEHAKKKQKEEEENKKIAELDLNNLKYVSKGSDNSNI